MSETFTFFALAEPVSMEEEPARVSETPLSSKRARASDEVHGSSIRNSGNFSSANSFKSRLLGLSNPSTWEGFGAKRERIKFEEDDVIITEDLEGPVMTLSPSIKEQLCKPWERALILKVMGRTHTLSFMRTKAKWKLIGQWQLTDLDDGYFIMRFQFKDDLEHVLSGGPWFIMNQYVVTQRWKPNFIPGEETIKAMAVWVRLSNIPMELMDLGLLWKIGRMLGSTCKVDPITESQARGRFARLCVEIDISNPLLTYVRVDGKRVRVEYENLDLICFKCGIYGHSKEICREGLEDKQGVEQTEAQREAQGNKPEKRYGPWLQVSYNKRGPDYRYGKKVVGNLGFNHAGSQGPTLGASSSRGPGKKATIPIGIKEAAFLETGTGYETQRWTTVTNGKKASGGNQNKHSSAYNGGKHVGSRFDILANTEGIGEAIGRDNGSRSEVVDESLHSRGVGSVGQNSSMRTKGSNAEVLKDVTNKGGRTRSSVISKKNPASDPFPSPSLLL
ncbi:hypothetical protein ACOSQ4_031468 [Xanthoceras sorbifolium]